MAARTGASPKAEAAIARLAALARSLTDRDRRLCRLLLEHRVLTTFHVAGLLFDGIDAARHRLLLLHRRKVVDRFRPFQATGSAPYHYVLGELGAAMLAAERGLTPAELGYSRAGALAIAHSGKLSHTVAVNELFAALTVAARRRPDSALVAWWSEHRCAQRWGAIVRPDGFGRWVQGDRSVEFFVEYDAGTEPHGRILDKLDRYARLASGLGLTTPTLIWFATPGREAAVRRTIGSRAAVPVATASGPIHDPAGPVWLPIGARTRVPLAQLGHPLEPVV